MQLIIKTLLLVSILGALIWASHAHYTNIANIMKCGPDWKVEGCE